MSFFALLLSFSSPDKQRFENVRDGMVSETPPATKSAPEAASQPANLKSISKEILDEIKRQKLEATVSYDARGVAVEFDPKLFFKSGSAEISKEYRRTTDGVMKIITNTPNRYHIIMEGHTDDEPIARGSQFKSNWELSSARAVNLLNDLKKRGVVEQRMSVNAFAHTRPKIDYKDRQGQSLLLARAANRRGVIRIE
jgi:chemotaxis protein MotB